MGIKDEIAERKNKIKHSILENKEFNLSTLGFIIILRKRLCVKDRKLNQTVWFVLGSFKIDVL